MENKDISEMANLKMLWLDDNFNQPIDLSNYTNLTTLYFGHSYNQPTDLSMLKNLQHLHLGKSFNETIKFREDHYSLNSLYSYTFSKKIDLSNFSNLRKLCFNNEFVGYFNIKNVDKNIPYKNIPYKNLNSLYISYKNEIDEYYEKL